MKTEDLKTLKDVNQKKIELSNFMSKMYVGKEKNLKKGKNLRREIAQMLTTLNMKGVGGL